MGTQGFKRTTQFLIVGSILLAQLIILTRTFPVFFDGDAFFYFAHHLQGLGDLKKCILNPDAARQYRPLGQMLFSFIFYPLFGLNHTMYAAVALGFHIMSTVLVFLIFRALLNSDVSVITAAIFWALNPVAIYVTHSFGFFADFTYGFFYVLAIFLFIKYIQSGNVLYAFGVFGSFVLSLGCKEMAVSLPVVLVFITIGFLVDKEDSTVVRSRSKWVFYVMFGILMLYIAAYLWITGGKFYDLDSKQNYYFNFSVQNLIGKLEYLLQAFFMPFPEYQKQPAVAIIGRRLAFFTFPFIILFGFFLLWPGLKRNSKIWLGFFLFFLILTPVLFINPSEFFHNTYIPIIGLALATGIFFEDFSQFLKQTKWFRPELIFLYGLAIVFLSLYTNQQIFLKTDWRIYFEKTSKGIVNGFKDLNLHLPKGSVVYMLWSPVPQFPWYIYDGRLLNFYVNDPTLTVRFQQWDQPFPLQEIRDKKGFVLAFTDNRFFDLTDKYVDEMYNKKGVKLLNSFDRDSVYVPPSIQGTSNLGTPDNQYAFVATFSRNGNARLSMVTLAGSIVRLEIPVLTKESRLFIGTTTAFDIGDGAEGRIYLDSGSKKTMIYSRFVDPATRPQHRQWVDEVIPLDRFAGLGGNLIFECDPGPSKNADADWFLWSQLRLEGTD